MKNKILITLPLLLAVAFFFPRTATAAESESLTDYQKTLIMNQIVAVQSNDPNLNAYMVYRSRSNEIILALFQEPYNGIIEKGWKIRYLQNSSHSVYTYRYDEGSMKWDKLVEKTTGTTSVLLTRWTSDFPVNDQIEVAVQDGQVLYANFSFKDSSGTVFFPQAPLTVGLTSTVASQTAVVAQQVGEMNQATAIIAIGTVLSLIVLPPFVKKSFSSLCK